VAVECDDDELKREIDGVMLRLLRSGRPSLLGLRRTGGNTGLGALVG